MIVISSNNITLLLYLFLGIAHRHGNADQIKHFQIVFSIAKAKCLLRINAQVFQQHKKSRCLVYILCRHLQRGFFRKGKG